MNFSEFEQAGGRADAAFEERLQRAARLPVPGDLPEQLKALAIAARPAGAGFLHRFRYALAALLVLATGAAVLLRQHGPADSVEAYVAHHFQADGYALLEADTPNDHELPAVLSSFKLGMNPELASQVRFVKYCPTPEGMGIHLVLGTSQGLVTVILMPGLNVTEGERFAFDALAAELTNLPGLDISAAIVASPAVLGSAPQQAPADAPEATGQTHRSRTLAASLATALHLGVWRQPAGA